MIREHMNSRLITKGFFLITRVVIISLCFALPWTGAFVPRACSGLDPTVVSGEELASSELSSSGYPGFDSAEFNVTEEVSAAEAARESSNTLTITTYKGSDEGHLITFPDSTTMSIDCASGSITTKSHFHTDHCADCGSGQYNRNNVYPGQVIYNKDGVTVTVVAANSRVIGQGSANVPCPAGDENQESMALLVKYRGFDYLTGGDLYGSVEGPLGSKLKEMGVHVDVLKISHHGTGSNSSSSLSYLQNISPEYATISGKATDPLAGGATTIPNLIKANVKTIYCIPDYGLPSPVPTQVCTVNGNLTITTDGSTYTFSGGSPYFYHGPYQVDEYVPPPVIPPHLMVTEVALDTHCAPENHDWIELYLPPDASRINLYDFYQTDLDEVQRAATSTVTIMPGDVVILHDASGPSENDTTGKGSNGWWDIYVENPGSVTWNPYDDQFVVCSRNPANPAEPAPETIIDAVVWSNDDGEMRSEQVADGNYLIQEAYHWGDPTAGIGSFSATNEGPAIGDINYGYAQRLTTEDTNSVLDWTISATHSQGTPPPTPTPIPTQPPAPPLVKVILNSSSLAAGEMLIVSVVVQPVTGRQFDAYAVITGTAGTFSIQFGNRLHRGLMPIVQNIRSLPNGYSGVLLKITIPQGVSGDYRVVAGLVDAGGTVKGPGSAFASDIEYITVR